MVKAVDNKLLISASSSAWDILNSHKLSLQSPEDAIETETANKLFKMAGENILISIEYGQDYYGWAGLIDVLREEVMHDDRNEEEFMHHFTLAPYRAGEEFVYKKIVNDFFTCTVNALGMKPGFYQGYMNCIRDILSKIPTNFRSFASKYALAMWYMIMPQKEAEYEAAGMKPEWWD